MAAFDLLYLSGYDPRKLPPIEHKTHLKKPIANTAIQFSESFEIDGPDMFTHACGIGLEGVVSNVRDSRIDEPAIARLHQRGAATLGRPIG